MDPAFIKDAAVRGQNWNGADAGKVELKALLPEADRAKLDEAFGKSAQELLSAVSKWVIQGRRASRSAPRGRLLHLVLRRRFRRPAGRIPARRFRTYAF